DAIEAAGLGTLHDEDDVGVPERFGAGSDARAGGEIVAVRDRGGIAGAGLHRDAGAEADKLLDRLRSRADAPLARLRFLEDRDLHSRPPCSDQFRMIRITNKAITTQMAAPYFIRPMKK